MRTVALLLTMIGAASALAGCDVFSPDTYWSSDDYELTAIDTKGQMMLAKTGLTSQSPTLTTICMRLCAVGRTSLSRRPCNKDVVSA